MTDARKPDAVVQALVDFLMRSVRYANFAAGEGIFTTTIEHGDPAEFVMEYLNAIGSDDFETDLGRIEAVLASAFAEPSAPDARADAVDLRPGLERAITLVKLHRATSAGGHFEKGVIEETLRAEIDATRSAGAAEKERS